MSKTLSEAEIKIELSDLSNVTVIKQTLLKMGFGFIAKETLQEYYITKSESALGGWDFERLRAIDGTIFLRTVKKWSKDSAGNKIRLEDESTLSKEDFNTLIENGYEFHFTKAREDFRGIINELESTISIDTLHHNETDRFFLECEVIVSQDSAFAAREMLKRWASATFGIDTSKDAPSMIDIVNSSNAKL